MAYQVLDPTNEASPPVTPLAPRPASLEGKTVGIISNGKEGAAGYFAHLEQMMKAEFGVARVIVRMKSNASHPADPHIIDEITQWHAAVTGIGD